MDAINEAQAREIGAAPPASEDAAQRKVPFWRLPPIYRYGFLAFILIVWELGGPLINPIFFSYPSKILAAAYHLTLSGELPYYTWQSLQVLFYGLGFAILIGIPLAVVMARVRPIDWALDMPINALYATPMAALVPLLVLWFGIHMQAKIIVVFLFAIFPILINTYQGVRECDKNIIEVARSFRASETQMWLHVLLPWSMPYMTAGIRLAIGRGLVGMIIAEFFTSISGLGYMITRYTHIFEMDKAFVPVLLLMILGVSMTAALKWVERRTAPWSRADA
jgi:ABC-type nitrate/sulfonate/bicarbonate transport system permease component